MIIYCAGPIRGDRSYAQYFQKIVQMIQKLGHVHLTELTTQAGEGQGSISDDRGIYRRDLEWLYQADVLIAEVSAPSLGVGYEVSYALRVRNIPVLCLRHRSSGSLSAMISGNPSKLLTLETYESTGELEEILERFVQRCTSSA
jgi:nucleoside 2-deoxyribosyltransferase